MSNFFNTETLKEEFNISDFSDSVTSEAEYLVLQRYIDTSSSNPQLGVFPQLSISTFRPRLKGFVGTIDNPQIDDMDDTLVFAIRQTIANYLDYEKNNVDGISVVKQGDQRINYNDNKTTDTSGIYKPLRIFDNRETFRLL